MSGNASDLLTNLLKQVSRSFYLTMRILPPAIRPQVSLAYLFARATDTIADTELVPVQKRLEALVKLRNRILGRSSEPVNFADLATNQASVSERALLERFEEAIQVLSSFSAEDQQRIREVLTTITSGQELDLTRFAHASPKRVLSLQSEGELDGYTYRVAGCVGEFWTKMCRAHLFPSATVDEKIFLTNGVKLGKGLQLINILRDLPRDLRQGRCYFPREDLVAVDLTPEALLNPASEAKFRPAYNKYLARAESHLQAGWAYTNALPTAQKRLRLACAWPVLIGVRTISKLQTAPILSSTEPVKINRPEVRSIIFRSIVANFLTSRWEGQFEKAR
jgi:farnesyl-diphosphate farnesyltransferase